GPGDGEQLPGDGTARNLDRLTRLPQARVDRRQTGIVAGRTQAGEVERSAQAGVPTTGQSCRPLQALSGLPFERRQAGEVGGRLGAGTAAEIAGRHDQRDGGQQPDTGNGLQALDRLGPGVLLGGTLGQLGLQLDEVLTQGGDQLLQALLDAGNDGGTLEQGVP